MDIYFAPLQGYTEDVYRRIHHKHCGAVAAYYSPFVRLEHGEVRAKDLRDLRPDHNQGVPLVPQVIASGGNEMRRVTGVVRAMGYRRIDLNMGCPFPLQTRHGRGAGLLPRPDAVGEIAEVMQEFADVAFSVKMRLGMEQTDEWRAVVDIVNRMPLSSVAIHPRVARQQYKGEMCMEAFDEMAGRLDTPWCTTATSPPWSRSARWSSTMAGGLPA